MNSPSHKNTILLTAVLAVSCGDSGSGHTANDAAPGVGTSTSSIDPTSGGVTGSASTVGDGTGTGATGDGTTAGANTDGGPKFDLPSVFDAPDYGPCGDGMDDVAFSYIWIANSGQGTVSKIDTKTGVEEGRFWTDPSMGLGSPSRTSVNLLGDVAVSNRSQPSTTKIAARPENCVDLNGNGVIDTSGGPNDVRDWGTDECVLWHTTFPDSPFGILGPRPTQWTGKADQNGCPLENPLLWVGYEDNVETAHFVRIDGDTGQKFDEATYPWGPQTLSSLWGPYGGAVNLEGDLWAIGLGIDAPLVHVDSETLAVTNYGNPGGVGFYGIAVDGDGNPWIGGHHGVVFFDVATKQWTVLPTGGTTRGISIDRHGRAWAAADTGCGLTEIDVLTRTVVNPLVPLPGCVSPWGVAIDADGYVWVPDMNADLAFKLDPDTHQVVLTVEGLVFPYTYSDMTGAGLALVINPPG